MRPWWERRPETYLEELEAFEARGLKFVEDEAAKESGRLVLNGSVAIRAGEETRIIVVYPETFPLTRFNIFAPDLRLQRHQNPFGGHLCLLPQGREFWRPSYRAADFVAAEVPRLVRLVEAGGPSLVAVEDPQGEPFTGLLPFPHLGGILVPESALHIDPTISGGQLELRFEDDCLWLRRLREREGDASSDFGKAILAEVRGPSGTLLATAEEPLLRRFKGPRYRARWARIESPTAATSEKVWHSLRTAMPSRALAGTSLDRFDFSAVLLSEEVQQGVLADAWMFAGRPNQKHALGTRLVSIRGLRFSLTQLSARIPELSPLATKTAAIIGLGALGSPVAFELARALIGHLRVADPDYIDPAGGVRWLSAFDGAGAWKTAYVAAELARTYPYTRVSEHRFAVGETPTDVTPPRIAAALSGTDLVIDATAEVYEVSRAIADVSAELGVPQVYVWSIDGYGGVVARVIPGQTGCHYCLLKALEAGGSIRPPPAASSPERVRLQPRGCRDRTYTGSSLELAPLAAQAARLAASMLCAGEPKAYPQLAHDVFVLEMRAPDGALLTPTWTSYALPKSGTCPTCR